MASPESSISRPHCDLVAVGIAPATQLEHSCCSCSRRRSRISEVGRQGVASGSPPPPRLPLGKGGKGSSQEGFGLLLGRLLGGLRVSTDGTMSGAERWINFTTSTTSTNTNIVCVFSW